MPCTPWRIFSASNKGADTGENLPMTEKKSQNRISDEAFGTTYGISDQ